MPDVDVIIEVIQDINMILGKQGPLHINTGVFDRGGGDYEDDQFDTINDMVVIGENGNKITLDDIMQLFKIMEKQFDLLYEDGYHYGYFYEGISYDDDNDTYEVLWGT